MDSKYEYESPVRCFREGAFHPEVCDEKNDRVSVCEESSDSELERDDGSVDHQDGCSCFYCWAKQFKKKQYMCYRCGFNHFY